MKTNFWALTTALSFLFASFTHSQEIPAGYEVATWLNFTEAAITYTFDDGTSGHTGVAVPMFNEYGYKLTLNTVTGEVSDWDALRSAAADGHEVASHSVTHSNFNDLSDSEIRWELSQSQTTIEENIPGYKCETHAYPYCIAKDESICEEFYIAGRSCQGYIEKKVPDSYYYINSVSCGTDGDINDQTSFRNYANNAATQNGWLVMLIHGVDNDGGGSQVTSAWMRGTLDFLDARRAKFWVGTFGQVVKYIREREAASIYEIASTDTSRVIQVTDGLPDEMYNMPITISYKLPSGWDTLNVFQAGNSIDNSIVSETDGDYLHFNAVPDAGNVYIYNSSNGTPPIDTTPTDTVPIDTVPIDTVPIDTVPIDTIPIDTVPIDTVPIDTVPIDTIPIDTVPIDTVPIDSNETSVNSSSLSHDDLKAYSDESYLYILFNPLENQAMLMSLFDTYGRKINEQRILFDFEGRASCDINRYGLKPGIYIVQIRGTLGTFSKVFLL